MTAAIRMSHANIRAGSATTPDTETPIEALIAGGLEPQLRARLARLLPEEPSPPQPSAAPPPSPRGLGAIGIDVDGLAAELAGLRAIKIERLGEPERAAIAAARRRASDLLQLALAAARAGRTEA